MKIYRNFTYQECYGRKKSDFTFSTKKQEPVLKEVYTGLGNLPIFKLQRIFRL